MTQHRLLFLSYYYAPHHAVASIRSTNLARYLADLGWQVTVVTPDPCLIRQHDATLQSIPEKPENLRIVPTGHRYRFLFPSGLKCTNSGLPRLAGGLARVIARRLGIERERGWLQPARCEAERLLSQGSFNAILSSGGPWASHRLASDLNRKTRIPCILDYRDLWCGNPHTHAHQSEKEMRLERNTRAAVTAVTAVSRSLLSVQSQLFRDDKPCAVITNGYAPQETVQEPTLRTRPFVLLYAGRLYPPDSSFTPFALAFAELKRRAPGKDIQLHYIGPSTDHVRQVLDALAPKEGTICEGRVPRAEALRRLQQCSISLVSTSDKAVANSPEAGIITGKIFEIFAARKPYLAIAPQNSDLHEIICTAGGGRAFIAQDIYGIANYLESVMRGSPPPYMSPEKFAWSNLARDMASVLENVVRSKRD